MAEEVVKSDKKGPNNEGLGNDLCINTRPQGMTDEEAEQFLAMDIRAEFNEITVELEKFHGIFSQLWEMGYPRLTWDLPTAAVAFDKEGRNVDFLWNPLFWKKIDKYTKSFVICHEVLHVMLSHGLRTRDCPLPELANKALDVVVNHMLVSKFGFDRQSIDIGVYPEGHEKAGEKIEMCWIDTVFPGMEKMIERDKPFEYYYRMLEQNSRILPSGKIQVRKGGEKGSGQGQGQGQGGEDGDGDGGWQDVTGETLDGHDNLEDFEEDRAKDEISDTLDNQLDDDEKRELSEKVHQSEDGNAAQKAEENEADRKEKEGDKDNGSDGDKGGKKAGSIAGRIVYKANVHQKVQKKRKWETVIKKWSRKYKEKDKDEEQWTRRARRYSMISPQLMLPTEAEVEDKSETRIKVRFYQDTSGSCYGFRDRFFAAARSLPPDRFDVELYCFDTDIYEASLEEGKLYGFGGTSFSILEAHIQRQLKNGELTRHPEAVFVITDGYGDNVRPAMPDKWYWFLSDNYRQCIPDTCNIFPLSEYE